METARDFESACRMLGRVSIADRIRDLAPALQTLDARALTLGCIKAACAVRVPSYDLTCLVRALHGIAGVEVGDLQRAVETEAADLPHTDALRSLWVATDDDAALAALGRLVARFPAMEELVVVSACDSPRSSPYSVAERMRVSMRAEVPVTAALARADFSVGSLRVVVVREPEIARVFAEGAAARSGVWAFVLVAPVSALTLETVVLHAPLVFSATASRRAVRASGWVDYAREDAVVIPDALLDPRARLAAMERGWGVVASVFTPRDPGECLLAVRRCVSSAASCLGVATCVGIVDAVLAAVRGGAPVVLCEWHPDLARAAANLAIALAHNVLAHVADADAARAQPALSALFASAHGFSDRLCCAYDALLGIPPQARGALADICAEISPVPVTVAELLYVLYALYRARLQGIRDAEAALGCGPLLSVDVHVECTLEPRFVHAHALVALE